MLNADRAKDPEYAMRKLAKGQTITLADQVRGLLPTPKATDGDKGSRTMEGAKRELARGKNIDLGMVAKLWPTPCVDGNLNPQWVEWLMGYPEGWTDLKDSETP